MLCEHLLKPTAQIGRFYNDKNSQSQRHSRTRDQQNVIIVEKSHLNPVSLKQQQQANDVCGFIQQQFRRAYQADIQSFMPTLLAWQMKGQFKSALGIRTDRQPLFIEQYFDCSAKHYLLRRNLCHNSARVAELGNMCSTSRRYSLPMMALAMTALHLQGIDHALFTANQAMRKTLESYQLPLVPLLPAQQNAIAPGKDHWGSYYQHTPEVMTLAVAPTMEKILEHKDLAFLAEHYSNELQTLNRALEVQS